MLGASQEIRDQFPGHHWMRFGNGYFEVYLFIYLRERFVKNSRVTSIIGDVFTSYDR